MFSSDVIRFPANYSVSLNEIFRASSSEYFFYIPIQLQDCDIGYIYTNISRMYEMLNCKNLNFLGICAKFVLWENMS